MTMLTTEEKLKRLKEAHDSRDRCQPIIDAFRSDAEAQKHFYWCTTFVNEASPTRDKGLINRVFKLATQLILLS